MSQDRLELPGQPYGFALWNLIIRPPRRRYDLARLGPKEFRLWSCGVKRVDIDLVNSRKQTLRCSHFLPVDWGGPEDEPRPVVVYLHQNASCRLEALGLVPLFLPLGISVFSFDFAGCGESDGEYISLGWFERDDLAECVEYLRGTNRVSYIGLWGRSMGAVTALLHADRDPSIAGMVLDSPFCNLRQLASELAQSELLSVKIPSWLLSGALAMGRLRIKSLCGFDIDQLVPERHVGESFIPALFLHGDKDDFIAPHHTQTLYQAYNGDKELEIVEGDHNSPRASHVTRKAVGFFCRAFRSSPVVQNPHEGGLASVIGVIAPGYDVQELDASYDTRVIGRQGLLQAAKPLIMSSSKSNGSRKPLLGQKFKFPFPFRAEISLQLNEAETQAGLCMILLPLPSEWGGVNRPPIVIFAYASARGIKLYRAVDGKDPEEVASTVPFQPDCGVPIRMDLECHALGEKQHIKVQLATGGPELVWPIGEECDPEVVMQPCQRFGDAQFYEVTMNSLAEPAKASAAAEGEAPAETFERGISTSLSAPEAPRPDVTPRGSEAKDSGMCQSQ